MVWKLQIQVIQARSLAAKDCNGLSDPYVRIQLGAFRAKSTTVYKSLNPVWNEDFIFIIESPKIELIDITVWDSDLLTRDDFLGKVSLNLKAILDSEITCFPPTWYALQKRESKSRELVTGDIEIAYSLWSDDIIKSGLDCYSSPISPCKLESKSNQVSNPNSSPKSDSDSESSSRSSQTLYIDYQDSLFDDPYHQKSKKSSKEHSRYGKPSSNDNVYQSTMSHQDIRKRSVSQSQIVLTSKEHNLLSSLTENLNSDSNPRALSNSPSKNRFSTFLHFISRGKEHKPTVAKSENPSSPLLVCDSFSLDFSPSSTSSSSSSLSSSSSSSSSTSSISSSSPVSSFSFPSSLPVNDDLPKSHSAPSDLLSTPSSPSSSHSPAHTNCKSSLFRTRSSFTSFYSSNSVNQIKEKEEKGLPSSSSSPSSSPSQTQEFVPISWFDEERKEEKVEKEMPPPLSGGIVLDQTFKCSPHELNGIIFKPDSDFASDITAVRKVAQLNTGPWIFTKEDGGIIKRNVSYMTAPSSLVKSVLATEENHYVRADSGGYVINFSVATPDVPYGNSFRTELQFCISPVQGGYSHLRVSWQAKFLQSTMMKSVIENGMKNGIKATYVTFLQVLSKYATPISVDLSSQGDKNIAKSQNPEPKSQNITELLKEKSNQIFTYCSFFISLLSVLFLLPLHLYECKKSNQVKQGIETYGLDLPDSIYELIFTSIILICLNHTVQEIYKEYLFPLFKHGHHGQMAKGEGWLITISLIKGENLYSSVRDYATDPYIIFTCNGKTRSSSVKLGTSQPVWNEILEFDAFDDPPSILSIEAMNYGGPFSGAEFLGHADINFLKISKMDNVICLPLEGRIAKAKNAKIHLRVLLTNTNSNEKHLPKFFQKMEKEVGKKFNVKSKQRNTAFQKLFNLPEHEFLFTEFTCAVKKKIPIQGRIFISPHLLGFYSNIFGMKTKFCLLWDDVEEMRENAPSIHSFNRLINPSITFYLKKGKGGDCANGSYGMDASGRLKLRFLSFLRPNLTFRIIQAMWKNHNLSLDQQLEKVKEEEEKVSESSMVVQSLKEEEENENGNEIENEKALEMENAKMEEVVNCEIPVSVEQFLNIVDNEVMMGKISSALDHRNSLSGDWEIVETGSGTAGSGTCSGMKMRRTLRFNLPPQTCQFNSTICVIQQKCKGEGNTWCVLEEVITMPDMPFGDDFQVETRKEVRQKKENANISVLKGYVGITWLKSSPIQQKISKNVIQYQKKMMKSMVDVIVREVIAASQGNAA